MRTWILDDLARAAAFRAYRCLLDDAEHTALLVHYLTAAVTVGTGRDAVRIFCTCAMAVRTYHLLVNFHLLLDGSCHLFQRQLHFDADVAASAHASLLSAATKTAPAKTTEVEAAKTAAKAPSEHIGKVTEDIA